MAPESINLSASLSPNQNFTPLNRLHEISPYVSLPPYHLTLKELEARLAEN